MKINLTRKDLLTRGGILDEILDKTFDAAALLDSHCNTIYISPGLAKVWATSCGETCISPKDEPAIKIFKKVLDTGKGNYEMAWTVNKMQCIATQIPIYEGDTIIGLLATLKFLNLNNLKKVLSDNLFKDCNQILSMYDSVARVHSSYSFKDFIGKSPSIQNLIHLCKQAANTTFPILLLGETGTGKELLSHAIHTEGNQNMKSPFIRINCSCIPHQLLESELFGHEKGAFTGAHAEKKGKFELAAGGTILLDEIGDMDLHLQGKLLRVIEDKEFERVGGTKLIPLKARIISATNRNLFEMTRAGQFREDLYYRLCILEIHIPSLRERCEDIPLLVQNIIEKNELNLSFTSEAMEFLCQYEWPGNVRQLKNFLTRLSITKDRKQIPLEAVKSLIPTEKKDNDLRDLNDSKTEPAIDSPVQIKTSGKNAIETALKHNNYNISDTAKYLNISRPTLYKRIREHNIIVRKAF